MPRALTTTITTPTDVLDAAYDRLARWGFDELNGYVNHGPMVCEALAVLGRPAEVDSWSRQGTGTPPVTPVAPPPGFARAAALGDASRTGEWMGYFERAVAAEGWPAVLGEWLPRLLPGLGAALFHGAIRCAHATRAIAAADTPARRAELVRSLGYWAGVWAPGHPSDAAAARAADDPRLGLVHVASDAAGRYLAKPNIIHLHGITAAMAVAILVEHTDETAAATALAHVKAEHAGLCGETAPVAVAAAPDIDDATLLEAAVASGEAHAVKLVEACRRGALATGDPVFAAAAERVVRRGRRLLRARVER